MSSNAARIVAVVAILLTVVLAVLGWRVSQQYAENSERAQAEVKAQAEQAQAPKILAVIAVQPLSAYQKIAKDAVVLAEVAVAPKDYYTSLEDVVGREPLVDVDQGAPLTQRYFAEGNVLAKSIPPGHQAVSVEVSDVIGVGGFVRPGDMVDVLLYLKGTGDLETSQARVLLENTRVLAYHELLVDRPEGLKDQEQPDRTQGRRQRTAVLAVPDKDTTRLMLGASQRPPCREPIQVPWARFRSVRRPRRRKRPRKCPTRPSRCSSCPASRRHPPSARRPSCARA
jgi:pilus assembly protein CpaB